MMKLALLSEYLGGIFTNEAGCDVTARKFDRELLTSRQIDATDAWTGDEGLGHGCFQKSEG